MVDTAEQTAEEVFPWKEKLDPNLIVSWAVEDAGERPSADDYFKKDGTEYLVHTSRSILAQVLIGYGMLMAGAIPGAVVFALVKGPMLWPALGAAILFDVLLVFFVFSSWRETRYDPTTGTVKVVVRKFLIAKTISAMKSNVQAVELTAKITKWKALVSASFLIKLRLSDGKTVPVTVFAFSNGTEVDGKDENAALRSVPMLPRKAWVLSRVLGVPVEYSFAGTKATINSVSDARNLML